MSSTTTVFNKPSVRFAMITLYYVAILAGIFVLRGREAFASAPFIYQAF
jgi:hypothetical protein